MSSILEEIETKIEGLKTATTKSNVGVVRETGDGVARIEGLSDVMLNEMIEFPNGVFGLALNLEETEVGAILLGESTKVAAGEKVELKDYRPLYCIYVAVGQKNSNVARALAVLEKEDAMPYTTIISASASDSATNQYLAPFAGAAMGEWFMDNAMDALIIYD